MWHLGLESEVGLPRPGVVKIRCDDRYRRGNGASKQALKCGVTDEYSDVENIFVGEDVLIDATIMPAVPRDIGVRENVPRVVISSDCFYKEV